MDTNTNNIKSQGHGKVDQLSGAMHDTVEKVSSVASRAQERLKEGTESLKYQKDRLLSNTTTYVEQHPFTAIGIAVAAGFLLGALLKRSGHSDY